MIVDAHPKEFVGVKLFSNRIRQIYRYSLHCAKKGALDNGLTPLNLYDFENDEYNTFHLQTRFRK